MDEKLQGILVVIVIIIWLSLQTSTSELICKQSICKVKNNNLFNITTSTRIVPWSNIKNFEYRSRYERTGKYSHRYKYYIYANLKNGQSYKFFKSKGSEYRAKNTVAELNKALHSKPDNIYISY